MTLATTCPSCRTSFKVVPDQLKLRRGLVRCGKCQHVFSGIDFLTYVEPADSRSSAESLQRSGPDRSPPARTHSPAVTTILAAAQARAVQAQAVSAPAITGASSAHEPSEGAIARSTDLQAPADPMPVATDDLHTAFFIPDTGFGTHALDGQGSTTATALTATAPHSNERHSDELRADELRADESRANTLQSNELLSQVAASPEPAPSTFESQVAEAGEFITLTSRTDATELPLSPTSPASPASAVAEKIETLTPTEAYDAALPGNEGSRWPAWAATIVLTFALGAQALVGWRDDIAARLPPLAPMLSQVLAPLGWSVASPRHRAALSIESFELRASSTAGEFELSALLSNRAAYPVALPALELTLKDSADGVMLRKVLTAEEYAGSPQSATSSLPGRSERAVRVRMALNGPAPAGYSADLFYP